jgi:hypothetical protein
VALCGSRARIGKRHLHDSHSRRQPKAEALKVVAQDFE